MPKEPKKCCVLTLELAPSEQEIQIIEKRFNIVEKLQNSLIGYELRKLKNLENNREYKEVNAQIKELSEKIWDIRKAQPDYDENDPDAIKKKKKSKSATSTQDMVNEKLLDDYIAKRKELYKKRSQLIFSFGFSEYQFYTDITPFQKKYVEHIGSQIAHRMASPIWAAFDKYFYGDGKAVHFKKAHSLNSVANKTANTHMKYANGKFYWNGGKCPNCIKLAINVKPPKTAYEKAMLQLPIKYYRVVRKWYKTHYSYYLQITFDGEPYSKGRLVPPTRVGLRIGLTSVSIVTPNEIHTFELAEGVRDNDDRVAMLQQAMDGSRRGTNRDNYNPDGTIRKGVKLHWVYSKEYRILQGQVRELKRKNADIRKYQHTCLANFIMSLGGNVYVNKLDFKRMQREEQGQKIGDKAPSSLLTILDMKLKQAGYEGLHYVNTYSFKASQYDHTDMTYSELPEDTTFRTLSNGDIVEQSFYSAFLLMNSNDALNHADQELCEANYEDFKLLYDAYCASDVRYDYINRQIVKK